MSVNGGGGGPPFLIPPPPPPPPLPPAHHLNGQPMALVSIKSEPCEIDFDNNNSSHDEILNSEFGQQIRDASTPSGRTVLGKKKSLQGQP